MQNNIQIEQMINEISNKHKDRKLLRRKEDYNSSSVRLSMRLGKRKTLNNNFNKQNSKMLNFNVEYVMCTDYVQKEKEFSIKSEMESDFIAPDSDDNEEWVHQ